MESTCVKCSRCLYFLEPEEESHVKVVYINTNEAYFHYECYHYKFPFPDTIRTISFNLREKSVRFLLGKD